jgi:hypothetical protein
VVEQVTRRPEERATDAFTVREFMANPAWLVLAMIGACTHSTENDVEGESQGIRLFTRPVFDDEPIVPGCFVGGLLNGRLAPSVDGFGTAMFALPTPSMGAMLMCARRFLEREP